MHKISFRCTVKSAVKDTVKNSLTSSRTTFLFLSKVAGGGGGGNVESGQYIFKYIYSVITDSLKTTQFWKRNKPITITIHHHFENQTIQICPDFKHQRQFWASVLSSVFKIRRDFNWIEFRPAEWPKDCEFRSCVKVKVAVLGFPSLIIYTVSVEVKNVELKRKSNLQITIPWEF